MLHGPTKGDGYAAVKIGRDGDEWNVRNLLYSRRLKKKSTKNNTHVKSFLDQIPELC